MSFFSELHRRNVVRVGIAYTVTAWLLLQVADVVMENIGAPDWVMKALLFLLLIGVLPTLLFAWVFELTPEGIKRESQVEAGTSVVHQTRRKLDTLIILMLVAVIGYLFWDSKLREPNGPVAQVAGEASAISTSSPAESSASGDSIASDDKSIAVLPFVNLSSDPEQEYFSDGISEELLNVLAQIPALRVAARTSSFQFKGDNRDIGEIAELLKVNHVLEGSVRKAGKRLRITAQLIEAENGYHLWSETYDRELDDIFAIQDEISAAIADALKAQLALDERGNALRGSRATANTPAYDAFLKGRGLINQRGNRAITEGVRELERSVRLDPDYAPARAMLAIGITMLAATSGTYGDLPLEEVNARAREQIAAAEALDEDFAELWAARSVLASVNGDARATLEFAERALAIRPNYADPLNWRVNALAGLGFAGKAYEAREALLEADPLSVIGRLNAVTTIAMREPERAMSIARSIAEQSPWASHIAQSRVYQVDGKVDRELEQLLLAYASDARDLLVNFSIVQIFTNVGLGEESLRVARETRPIALQRMGRYAEAEAGLRAAMAANPGSPDLRVALAATLFLQERYAEAVDLYRATLMDTGFGEAVYANGPLTDTARFVHALRQVGDDAAAEEKLEVLAALENDFRQIGEDVNLWQFAQGAIATLRGDRDVALDWLQKAARNGFAQARFMESPILASLAAEPAFEIARETVMENARKNRSQVLALICNNNPIPDSWRPLEETCATRG